MEAADINSDSRWISIYDELQKICNRWVWSPLRRQVPLEIVEKVVLEGLADDATGYAAQVLKEFNDKIVNAEINFTCRFL